MGALGFTFVTPEAARAWVHKYYNNLLNNLQKLTDYPSNPNVAMVSGFMCAATDEEAEAKAAGWTFFIFALSYYGRKGVDAPGTSDLWKEYQSWKGGPEEKKALESGLIGSPETIRRKLRQFQASRVDQVILLNQAGKTSHQDICDSLELFANEVMPEFHAAEAEHAVWKAEGAGARDRSRGPRCPEVHRHLQPPERAHRPPHAGAAQGQDGREGSPREAGGS